MLGRRELLAAATGALAAPALPRPAIGAAAANSVVKIVPQSDLVSIDPNWTPAIITRHHGYLVYDTLYGVTSALQASPQMAAGELVEDDGRRVTIILRDGLSFHDGEPVRARDCVASIQRWSRRNTFGDKLASMTDELVALDDRRLRFRLKRPFPLLGRALSNPNQPAFIMPERVAATDPFKQIDDPTGSGPFRLKRDEFNPGSRIAYERNSAYIPRTGGIADLTGGPKQAFFDRVEMHIIPEPATAAAALQTGEIDWYEQPIPEQFATLRKLRAVSVENLGPLPGICVLRFNFLHPPFDSKAIRQALLPAISSEDFMTAVMGNEPGLWQPSGAFTPGAPMASSVGLEPLRGPRSPAQAKARLAEAGYAGQLTRLIGPTDILAPAALTQVCADLFHRLDLNTDIALSDWGTVTQRRTSREPVAKGGWSALLTVFPGFSCVDPAGHVGVRGNGTGAGNYFGWPTIPRLETLRDQWFEEPDAAEQRRLCDDIQRTVMDELPIVPLGAYYDVTAIRRDITGRVPGAVAFWGMRRA